MTEGSGSTACEIADEVISISEQTLRLRHLRRFQERYDGALVEELRKRARTLLKLDPREAGRRAQLGLLVAESIQDRPGRLSCLIERTRAAVLCGDSDLAMDSLAEASHLAKALSDEAAQAELDFLRIHPLMAMERYAEARAEAERVLTVFERRNDLRGRILAHEALARLAFRMDLPREALRHFALAERLAPPSWGPRFHGTLAMNRANALVARRRFRAAERHYARARELFRAAGCERLVAHVDCNAAYGELQRGRHHEALRLYAECEPVLQNADDALGLAHMDVDRAELHLQLGKPDEAAAFAAAAETRFLTLGLVKERARAAFVYARAAELRGDVAGAASWYERSQDLFAGLGLSERVFQCMMARAELLERTGDGTAARTLAVAAHRLLRDDMNALCSVKLDLLFARLDIAVGRPAAAIVSAQRVLEETRRLEAPAIRIEALRIVGRARAEMNEVAPAISAFEQATVEIERMRRDAHPVRTRAVTTEEIVDVLALAVETSAALVCVERCDTCELADEEPVAAERVRHLRERLDAVHRGVPTEELARAARTLNRSSS